MSLQDMFNFFTAGGIGQQQGATPANNAAGMMLNGNLPGVMPNSNAPTYAPGAAGGQALADTVQSGGQGFWAQGLGAFLGGGYSPFNTDQNSQSQEIGNAPDVNGSAMTALGQNLGIDTSNYNTSLDDRANIGTTSSPGFANVNAFANALGKPLQVQLGGSVAQPVGAMVQNATGQMTPYQGGVQSLENMMNDKLQNYYAVGGSNAGWNPNSQTGNSVALYKDTPGVGLAPITNAMDVANHQAGFLKNSYGQDLLSAFSVAAPAFGGVAGLAGDALSGAGVGADTLTAASPYINAGINAGLGYAQGGAQGALGGLAGNALSSVGSGLMNGTSPSLTGMLGSSTLGQSPIQGFNSGINQLGLGNFGTASNFLGALSGNGITGNSVAQAGGGLLGSYLAGQLDPRLRSLGGTAGRSLGNMFYGK